ncbi:MAG: ATP-binding protein [Candidatus Acidifodinimicrobium sp.]
MDLELLKVIIEEQREGIKKLMKTENIIERELKVGNFIKYPNSLVILGVRRAGKSVLSLQTFYGEKFAYINFDDERLIGLDTKDLNQILQVFYELYGPDVDHLIFDEIQNIQGWELFVTRLRDTNKVIVTGSNSKLLSGELATRLTGRHIDVLLFPFSFREFLKYKKFEIKPTFTTKEKAQLILLLKNYLKEGGFPEAAKFGEEIIASIYNDILTKDIINRHKIKNIEDLRKVARYLVSNSANEFTLESLRSISGVKSLITVSNWVRYMEEAYLLFRLERFSFKLKQTFKAPKKIYCIDNSIISNVGVKLSEDISGLMENTVAIELFRRKSYNQKRWEIYYWKDHQQHEVDFLIKEDFSISQIIQVTYASSREFIKPREINNILLASKELHCNNLLIITWDYESEEKIKGKRIRFVPLWKWLLNL